MILSVVGLILAIVLPDVHLDGPFASTGILAIRVLDAQTNQPVVNSVVTIFPHGLRNRSVSGTANKQGECRIAASFFTRAKEVGWGRKQFLLQLESTEISASAPGYEPITVRWEDVSTELARPAEAPPGPPVEILLQQKRLP